MRHSTRNATCDRVSLRRPLSRYGFVAAGILVGWWLYQTGQSGLGTTALVWGLSEF